MNHSERQERRLAEPAELRDLLVSRNPTVYACLKDYRRGFCTLEQALARAIVSLCKEQDTLLAHCTELAWKQRVVYMLPPIPRADLSADKPTIVDA